MCQLCIKAHISPLMAAGLACDDTTCSVSLLCIHAFVYLCLHWFQCLAVLIDLFCLLRGVVAYMLEHEDVIKIPVNLKELQSKIKYAQTQLSQV